MTVLNKDIIKSQLVPSEMAVIRDLFSDEYKAAQFIECAKYPNGFQCPHCGVTGEPYRFDNRPTTLRCRNCLHDTRITSGSIMDRSKVPLGMWLMGASVVVNAPDVGAKGFQRAMGMTRYETAHATLRKIKFALYGLPNSTKPTVIEMTTYLIRPLSLADGS